MSKKLPKNICKFTQPFQAYTILVIIPRNRQFPKMQNFVNLMILTNSNFKRIMQSVVDNIWIGINISAARQLVGRTIFSELLYVDFDMETFLILANKKFQNLIITLCCRAYSIT